MRIAGPTGVTDAVEEFQYLNRQFAPGINFIAKLSRAHPVILFSQLAGYRSEPVNRMLGEIMIMRY